MFSSFLFLVRDSYILNYRSCLFSRWKIIETELRVRTVRCLICPEHVLHILAMLSVISLSFPVPIAHTSLIAPPVYLIRRLESLRKVYSSNFRTYFDRGRSSTRTQRAVEGPCRKERSNVEVGCGTKKSVEERKNSVPNNNYQKRRRGSEIILNLKTEFKA